MQINGVLKTTTPAAKPPSQQPRPFLCLNMIVKNESAIIERLLKSVVNYIDAYHICDTGSTDNTPEVITRFFENHNKKTGRQIHGIIMDEPFRDFGHNRSVALHSCIETLAPEYILLLDADMVFVCSRTPAEFHEFVRKHEMQDTTNVLHLIQGNSKTRYTNVRIVQSHPDLAYYGVTHEYVVCPENRRYTTIPHDVAHIADIGDGGSKADKFERDIKLLLKGLEENPECVRYTYYLANSYKDSGDNENAIKYYKRRIELGGWFQEVWLSYYSMGECYKHLGDDDAAIKAWLDAYNFNNYRIENLHKVIQHYRLSGKNRLAYGYYVMAANEIKEAAAAAAGGNQDDIMFLQKDVYDYKLDYELTIVGYYCNYLNYDLGKMSMQILNAAADTDTSICASVMSNYKFYSPAIIADSLAKAAVTPSAQKITWDFKKENLNILTSIGEALKINGGFSNSTPSFVKFTKDGKQYLAVVVRFVNYTINDRGEYENQEQIVTENHCAIVNISKETWFIEKMFELHYDTQHDGRYVGLEDVRLFLDKSNNTILYNCNRGIGEDGEKICVETGVLNYQHKTTMNSQLLRYDAHRDNTNAVEKNWVMFSNASKISPNFPLTQITKMVYSWHPLIIGGVGATGDILLRLHTIDSPQCFNGLRGSTNGVTIDNTDIDVLRSPLCGRSKTEKNRTCDEGAGRFSDKTVWFICHKVSYEDRRYYYHMVVVLDAFTMEVKNYTRLFTFEGYKVEYCLGFEYFEDTREFLVGYSTNDSTTKFAWLSREYIETMFIM